MTSLLMISLNGFIEKNSCRCLSRARTNTKNKKETVYHCYNPCEMFSQFDVSFSDLYLLHPTPPYKFTRQGADSHPPPHPPHPRGLATRLDTMHFPVFLLFVTPCTIFYCYQEMNILIHQAPMTLITNILNQMILYPARKAVQV